jgi:PTS system beta-glucosides-specific IIC component
MDYQKLAQDILAKVGGQENVRSLAHCATRLRFNLRDESKADKQALENMSGVLGVAIAGGQYQVIIGNAVQKVYQPLMDILGTNLSQDDTENVQKKNIGAALLETIASIFTPILPVITASGMLKAILSLCVAFKWVSADAMTYQVINFMADAAFYFLPIFLASSAAKKFNANPFLAMMVGGILLHPSFIAMVAAAKEGGQALEVLGLPIYNANYASTVVPIILTVWFMSYVERLAKKYSPELFTFFLVPLVTIMVSAVAALVVLGPLGYVVGNGIAAAVLFLESHVGWLVPMILGALMPLMIMTGTHYGIIPIGAANIMNTGYDTVIGPGNLASNIAQGGAALAVGLKAKNTETKQLAISSGITAVCGITEPAMFGVNLRFKTPLYAAMIGGGIGGLFVGMMGVARFATGSPGLLTLPVYIGGEGFSNLIYAVIGCAIAFVVSFGASFVMFKEAAVVSAEVELEEGTKDMLGNFNGHINSPVNGLVMPLSEVNDPTFAQEMLGKGCAIVPESGQFVAPFDGTVSMIFDTKHAIGLTSNEGVEVLLHIGLDTVQLGGAPFTLHVKQGDTVKAGQALVDVDLDAIHKAGFELVTPMIITNSQDFESVDVVNHGNVERNQAVLQLA